MSDPAELPQPPMRVCPHCAGLGWTVVTAADASEYGMVLLRALAPGESYTGDLPTAPPRHLASTRAQALKRLAGLGLVVTQGNPNERTHALTELGRMLVKHEGGKP